VTNKQRDLVKNAFGVMWFLGGLGSMLTGLTLLSIALEEVRNGAPETWWYPLCFIPMALGAWFGHRFFEAGDEDEEENTECSTD